MDSMQFLQLIPRIRVYEKRLLDRSKIERMMDGSSAEESLKVLQETDYAIFMNEIKRPEEYETLLSKELVRLYETMYKASPIKDLIDAMAVKYDYHNIKVLIKGKILKEDFSHMLIPVGMIDISLLKNAILGESLRGLPKYMEKCIEEINSKFEESKDPQVIDIVADKYLYAHINEIIRSKDLNDKYLDRYINSIIDLNNLKTLLRVKKQQKSVNFLLDSLVPGGTIDEKKYRAMFLENTENIPNHILGQYNSIVKEGIVSFVSTGSVSLFEKLIDNYLMKMIKEAKLITKGLEPVLAYMHAKESEIKQVRTIMVGKLNNIDKEVIRERLRDGYV
ncbi:MAG: V-type ATP synthase subunit C [Clostridium perfringens]|nr:V-type ATP synthase subunit C [Clostridium perfringens]